MGATPTPARPSPGQSSAQRGMTHAIAARSDHRPKSGCTTDDDTVEASTRADAAAYE